MYARENGIPVVLFPKTKDEPDGLAPNDLVAELRLGFSSSPNPPQKKKKKTRHIYLQFSLFIIIIIFYLGIFEC